MAYSITQTRSYYQVNEYNNIIPDEGLLTFRASTRSDNNIIDSIGGNNASILLPSFKAAGGLKGTAIDTGIAPESSTVWVLKGRFHDLTTLKYMGIYQNISGTNYFFRIGLNEYAGQIGYAVFWGNGELASSVAVADMDYHVFILYDHRFWVLDIDTDLTDSNLINIINNTTPNLNVARTWSPSEFTSTIGINSVILTSQSAYFSFISSYLGTITDDEITWQQKIEFTNAYKFYDTLDIDHPLSYHDWDNNANRQGSIEYTEYGNNTCLENGNVLCHNANSGVISVPFIDGVAPSVLPSGFVKIHEISSTGKVHNLADSLIEFTGEQWDRSDETIFSDTARGTYYDSDNPTRWHISELNQLTIKNYLNDDYQCGIFVRMQYGSIDIEDRTGLLEIFSYSVIKTGVDLLNVLNYTNEKLYYNTSYMTDPYNQIFKVIAGDDSIFTWNVNDNFFYTYQEIHDRIEAMNDDYFPDGIDTLSKRLYWMLFHTPLYKDIADNYKIGGDPLSKLNAYDKSVCGSCAVFAMNVMKYYYGWDAMEKIDDYYDPHTFANITDVTMMDFANKLWVYSGLYELKDIFDIVADSKLLFEPLRKVSQVTSFYENHPNYLTDLRSTLKTNTEFDTSSVIMKMPNTAYFQYPVKSTDQATNYNGESLGNISNLIVTIPTGVTGVVEMPGAIVRITGEGSVSVNDIAYSLPDDEESLKGVLQNYAEWYKTFTVLTNTGGLEADFLVAHNRARLLNKNTIDLSVISGAVEYEIIDTDSSIDTAVISVDKGDADAWTNDFNEEYLYNKSMKIPKTNVSPYDRVYFAFRKSTSKPLIQSILPNDNDINEVVASESVIDQCFAAILMPRDETFSTSLQLTFTTVDGSVCYYTTDGSDPDETDNEYTSPFTITETTTIKWINIREGYANSHINTRIISKT